MQSCSMQSCNLCRHNESIASLCSQAYFATHACIIKLSSWDAAKAAGVHQLQGLHWHGNHILGCPPSVDHDAFLHVAKYLRDHGIHRQTGEGGKDRRSIREVSLHTVSILPLCMCKCVSNSVLISGWRGSLDSQWDHSLAMNVHGSLSIPSLGRHLS